MRNKDEDADRFLQNNKRGIDESPTSMKMKNTFLLQHNNPSFDNYAAMMKKRKMAQTLPAQFGKNNASVTKLGDVSGEPNSAVLNEIESEMCLKINKINPQARDGHACILYDNKMVIFGGDRHHMPFNDLFLLDLQDFFFTDSPILAEAIKLIE